MINLATQRYISVITETAIIKMAYGASVREAIAGAVLETMEDQAEISSAAVVHLSKHQSKRTKEWCGYIASYLRDARPGFGVGPEVPIPVGLSHLNNAIYDDYVESMEDQS